MNFIYKTTFAVVLAACSQVALAAFPNDLYGFKLGDSLSTVQAKFKSKYGKSIGIDPGYTDAQKKCGIGYIGSNDILKLDDGTKVEFKFSDFKLKLAHFEKRISLSSSGEVSSYLDDLMHKYGQPIKITKSDDGSYSTIYYKNATMFADENSVNFFIVDESWINAGYTTPESENCLKKVIRNDLP
jgi:hypothetical protein